MRAEVPLRPSSVGDRVEAAECADKPLSGIALVMRSIEAHV